MVIFWLLVLAVSLIVLIKGADWLLVAAERVGLNFGLSPFIIGVTIVAIGTGLPELVSAVAAVVSGVNDLPVANAIGSNIANILLVIGLMAVYGGSIAIKKDLIDLDLPLLAVVTLIFTFVILDQEVTLAGGIILLLTYAVYIAYTIKEDRIDVPAVLDDPVHHLPSRRSKMLLKKFNWRLNSKISAADWVRLSVGALALAAGAYYTVESVVALAGLLNLGVGVITMAAVAFGTSLPEVAVCFRAVKTNRAEVALGNIIGSSVFNLLMVVGLPALLGLLVVDAITLNVGLPFMLAATFLFIVSGISRKVHVWEALMYLILYAVFLARLFQLL